MHVVELVNEWARKAVTVKLKVCLFLFGCILFWDQNPSRAADPEYFRGKTVRFVVGFSAGGGFDVYTRTVARHFGKHLPGMPTVIVENMTGAGSRIAAQHTYKVATPDGLTIGNFISGLLLQQLFGAPGSDFDGQKFEYIGVGARYVPVIFFTKASGITSMEKWMAASAPVKLGGTAPGSSSDDVPKILRATLGLPLRIVSGYKGFPEVKIATESGELDGACFGWDTLKTNLQSMLKSGEAIPVLQTVSEPHSDLTKVPLAISFAKTEEARQLIEIGIHDLNAILRLYALPPGTPKHLVQSLRRAFAATMKDPEFLKDAEKAKLDVDPISGEEVEKTVKRIFQMSPPMVVKLKTILSSN
jgi:tripartite-type tricarboxylate transporter receptor subunit TctC